MLRIGIIGLSHLGVVNATVFKNHHTVWLWDSDPKVMEFIAKGTPPFNHTEPGIKNTNHLIPDLASSMSEAVVGSDVIWITYDTPVVENEDVGNYEYIADRIREVFPYLSDGQVLLISSQVPVNFTRRLQTEYSTKFGKRVLFAYSPENLRRGKGLETCCTQDRIVIGIDAGEVEVLRHMFCNTGFRSGTGIGSGNYTPKLLWMSPEEAEMTKHALNAFLGTCIAFANEIGVVCDLVGVNPLTVMEGLRTEGRVGNKLPLLPGGPFTGGTLGRDLKYLEGMSQGSTPLLNSVHPSNNLHKSRVKDKGAQA